MSSTQPKKELSRQFLVEPTSREATQLAAELFDGIVCEAVSDRGICHVALAGGTTPFGLYQLLADSYSADHLSWDRVEVFFGDERDVPHDHVESNFGMIQRTLLDHVPIKLETSAPGGRSWRTPRSTSPSPPST